MSTYNDGKTNNNPVVSFIPKDEKNKQISKKRKENKDKLINQVYDMITDDLYGYKELVNEFIFKGISKMTQKDLKTWLN